MNYTILVDSLTAVAFYNLFCKFFFITFTAMYPCSYCKVTMNYTILVNSLTAVAFYNLFCNNKY